MKRHLVLVYCVLGIACVASAQTAEITGVITDSSGGHVPGANVTITNTEIGANRKTVSSAEGSYTIPLLRPGSYRVTVEKAGFQKSIRENVRLQVDQALRLDIILQLGTVQQTVDVTGAAPLVESETSSAGQVVQGTQVTELPLLGRDAYALGGLVPGVRSAQGLSLIHI